MHTPGDVSHPNIVYRVIPHLVSHPGHTFHSPTGLVKQVAPRRWSPRWGEPPCPSPPHLTPYNTNPSALTRFYFIPFFPCYSLTTWRKYWPLVHVGSLVRKENRRVEWCHVRGHKGGSFDCVRWRRHQSHVTSCVLFSAVYLSLWLITVAGSTHCLVLGGYTPWDWGRALISPTNITRHKWMLRNHLGEMRGGGVSLWSSAYSGAFIHMFRFILFYCCMVT